MRAGVILGVNLVVGLAALGWVLHRFGAPALAILGAAPSPPLLAAFAAAVVASVVALAWRWRFVLASLGPPSSLGALTLFRSAGHAVAVLVPSGRVGGDPLRAWLATRAGIAPGNAIASVAIDRTLEVGASVPFSILFITVLIQSGVPELRNALVTVTLGGLGLAAGVAVAVRRLRRGAGLVTTLAWRVGLDRLELVRGSMGVLEDSERAAARLVEEAGRMLRAFAAGLVSNLLVIAEFALLLVAFGLPSDPVAVVAAIFATGAASFLPVPAGVGVLEGALIWIFAVLGHPTDVGLAVALAVRLRELLWMLPGLLYLLARSLGSSFARAREAQRPSK
ncbi:MAG: lysylphosphatidylglycerol synthase transmembrane domain-containing protein [Myxococcota bacterium]|nr:lysylphosphatidylglycerol synthase transmembrane domain-containing protein [Myxococcota bacterium]